MRRSMSQIASPPTTTTTNFKLPSPPRLTLSPNSLSVPTPYHTYHNLPHTTTTTTLTTHSPTRSISPNSSRSGATDRLHGADLGGDDNDDAVNDDLFGSAAWKNKKRGAAASSSGAGKNKKSRAAGAATGSGKGTDGKKKKGATATTTSAELNLNNTKRWALVQFVEQRAKWVKGRARRWWREVGEVCEGFRVWYHGGADAVRGGAGGELGEEQQQQSPRRFLVMAAAAGGRPNGLAVPSAGGVTAARSREKGELTIETVAEETQLLMGNYIFHRLSAKALMSKRVAASAAVVAPLHSWVADDLYTAGQELERLYPRVYTDVSRRIAMTMTSTQIVRRALTSVLEDIFRSGVTWARVVAMVAISAAFAEECVVQGHPSFVEDVVVCGGHFVTLRLGDWLVKQGGWASFPTSRPQAVLRDDSIEGPTGTLLLVAGLLLILAIFLTLLFLASLCLRGVT